MLDERLYISHLIKINLLGLLYLIGAAWLAYIIISGKSPIKRLSPKGVLITKIFMASLPIMALLFINIPIWRDTIARAKPIEIMGVVERVRDFPPGFYFLSQNVLIDGRSLHLQGTNQVIDAGKKYKIYYLPHSRTVIKAERLE